MRLPARATLENCADLLASVPGLVDAGAGVFRLDASELRQFDSAAVSLLLQALRLAGEAGRGFALTGAPPALLDLARLYGVDGLLAPAC